MELISNSEYLNWLKEIKAKVSVARTKAALSANKEMIRFYFELGKMIVEQQEKSNWGRQVT